MPVQLNCPTALGRILALVVLFEALGAITGRSIAESSFVFDDQFKGVDITMPGGDKKLYPDPKVWAFTFWPGTRWPDSYGDGTNWLENNGDSQTYVTPMLRNVLQSPVPPDLSYDPFSIQPDGLHIKAAVLTPEQQAIYRVGGFRRFGSGMLLSRFAFTYGKIRVVAKLPSARGSWPALWLLPESHKWPPEIDIFEAMAWGPHRKQIHTGMLVPKGEKGSYSKWHDIDADPTKDFHEYGMDWTPDTITVLFDGKVLWQRPTPASMHQDMYLIVNLAVGGKWPFNELGVRPIDGKSPKRLAEGADLIQQDYPAEMVVRSIRIESPGGRLRN